MDTILTTKIKSKEKDGAIVDMTIEIGRPHNNSGYWSCPISITPFYTNLSDIRGNDSLHVLSIACATVIAILNRHLDQGALLIDECGKEYQLEHLYRRLYKRPKRKIPLSNVMKRITGISTPIFGVSWNPPERDRDIAIRILTVLEDQRLLFGDYAQLYNLGGYAEKALYKLRENLTNELRDIERETQLSESVIAMRTACRKCLSQLEKARNYKDYSEVVNRENMAYWFGAIGELRSTFGVIIANMSALYGVEVEYDLSVILPQYSEE